jgi:hypothetical protein
MAFKMRSGNTSTFKMMGSSSPMKDDHPVATSAERIISTKKSTLKDYSGVVDYFSDFKGTKEELLAAVRNNNKNTGPRDNRRISTTTAIRLWRKNNPVAPKQKEEVPLVEELPVVEEVQEEAQEETSSNIGGVTEGEEWFHRGVTDPSEMHKSGVPLTEWLDANINIRNSDFDNPKELARKNKNRVAQGDEAITSKSETT